MHRVYIISARRTALGTPGGLHKARRVEVLAEAAITSVLRDASIDPPDVEALVAGNMTAGGNPARLIGHASGLSQSITARTIDQECASGLAAILDATRAIRLGEHDVVLAGGAESFSTAPWRLARPRSPSQPPRFLASVIEVRRGPDAPQLHAGSERLACRLGITREAQDAYAQDDADREAIARSNRRFIGEIIAMRSAPNEVRDEVSGARDAESLAEDAPFMMAATRTETPTLTLSNTVQAADGAAFALLVSQGMYERLGRPPALEILGGAATATDCNDALVAPGKALHALLERAPLAGGARVERVELSELSALQAVALQQSCGLGTGVLNPRGGALTRGHAGGAAGAVAVVALFTDLVRNAAEARGAGAGSDVAAGVALAGAFDGSAVGIALAAATAGR